MKKLIIILIILSMTSCAVLKKDKTTTVKEKETLETTSDSISKETINKEIDDEAAFNIPEVKTDDSEYDRRVNEGIVNALRGINLQKSSGDNSYRFWYDEQLKQMRAEFKIGQTVNKETSADNTLKSQKSLEVQIQELIKKIVIPWWVYLIPIFLFRKQIVGILSFIYPPIRGLKTMKDILTPPSKET